MTAGRPYRSSGDRVAAEAFFSGHADGRRMFDAVVACLPGPVELAATKSRVACVARTRFLWCHEANDDGAIWLGFLLPEKVKSPRLRSGPAGGRWSHHTKLSSKADLDAELKGWLREAYEWDVQRHGPGRRVAAPNAPRPKARPAALWACPRCGQRFARRGQPHPCDRRAVGELFADYPKAIKVVQLVQAHLDAVSHGTVRMAATKTQVSFAARRRFAWVWVPEQAAGRGKPADPVVSFALRRREAGRRVREAVEARPGLWTHHVLVRSGRQVDARLKAWLDEAYATVGARP